MSTKDVKIKTGNLLNNFEPEVREITSQLSKVKLNLICLLKKVWKTVSLLMHLLMQKCIFFLIYSKWGRPKTQDK